MSQKYITQIILSLGLALLPAISWGATKPQGHSSTEPQRGIKIVVKGIKGKQLTVERFALSPSPAESNQGFAKYKVEQASDGSYPLTLPSDTLYHLMVYPDEAVSQEQGMESVSQEHTIELFANAKTSLSVKARYSKDYMDYSIQRDGKDGIGRRSSTSRAPASSRLTAVSSPRAYSKPSTPRTTMPSTPSTTSAPLARTTSAAIIPRAATPPIC